MVKTANHSQQSSPRQPNPAQKLMTIHKDNQTIVITHHMVSQVLDKLANAA